MMDNKQAFYKQLQEGLEKLNIAYSAEQLEQLWKYYKFFSSENKKYNLSSLTELQEVVKKHFLDSLAVLPYVKSGSRKRWIDIGTGAGFPGLVLKIFLPGDSFYLVDSSAKKVNFLNQLIYKLELDGIQALHARAEDLAQDQSWRESFDFTVSRAVASLNILAEYTLPFLKIGGKAYLYKGPDYKNELKEADKAVKTLGADCRDVKELDIPGLDAERYILILEKSEKTPKKYPRRPGIPKKRPL